VDDLTLAARAALSLAIVLAYFPVVVVVGAIAAGLLGRWNVCRVVAMLAMLDIVAIVGFGAITFIGAYAYLADADASSKAAILAMLLAEGINVVSFAMPAAILAFPIWVYARRRLGAKARGTT